MHAHTLSKLLLASVLAFGVPALAEGPVAPSGPVAQPEPPEVPPGPVESPVQEPPGSKEDKALWKAAGDLGNQLTSVRWTGNGMHWRIRNEDLLGRLEAAAKADPAAAARFGELRKALVTAQVASYEDLTGRWPVDPTRGCQYPRSILESAMQVAAVRDNRAQLEQARAAAGRCVDLARATLARVQRSTDALGRAIDAADQALPPMVPALPPPPAGK
jgi:hypothetical protein